MITDIWEVHLLGKLSIAYQHQPIPDFECAKAQELLCYLLSHPGQALQRESCASLLWGDCPLEQAKKHLRQTLWRLNAHCAQQEHCAGLRLVTVQANHVQLNPLLAWQIDIAVFEQAYEQVKRQGDLEQASIPVVHTAVRLYQGDFMAGCWYDWCIYERERYQNMYLVLLDKLVKWALVQGQIEEGLEYGQQILHIDPASERTHQHLMWLHALAGNRTAALHQFERCAKALREELDVAPDRQTIAIYEQIRTGQSGIPNGDTLTKNIAPLPSLEPASSMAEVLAHLRYFQTALSEIQTQIQRDIQLVEQFLPRQNHPS